MKKSLLLVPVLALVSVPAFGQGKSSLRKNRGAIVRTVPTDGPIVAGRAIGGIAVDDRGRVYSANFRTRVYRIERDGTVNILSGSFRQASGNTIDNGGELVQSEYELNQLYRVHEDGSRTLITDTGLFGPVGVVMDDNDDLYVVNYRGDTITRVAPDGTSSLFSSDPLLNGPNGITIDAAGDMYVANFGDSRLLRIDPTGMASIVAAVGPGSNAHVAALGGKLYVSKIWTHAIYEVTTGGSVKLLVGRGVPGTRDGVAPHQATLYHPNGITTDPEGKVLYTNNYIGTMGTPGSNMTVRAIRVH